MTHIPTELEELTSTFDHVPRKGIPEWKIFRPVRGDHIEMYGSVRGSFTSRMAADVFDEPSEDAYL
ncbi:hypothetical protein HY969_02135 [Candidatus Kaiserbacteria bacterium]|nr:hypothetical protein [Candidatus Kaiserbacteria bacterium]